MKVSHSTEHPEVLFVRPQVFGDARGFFVETYRAPRYREAGIDAEFVQDNHSRSTRHTLRGLHAQAGQAKLVRVVVGHILDVAVDIRVGSPGFGRHTAVILSERNHAQLYIPDGFAHGFVALSEIAEVEYKCSEIYNPKREIGIAWDDPEIAIPWPLDEPLLSERDRHAPRLADVRDQLPTYSG